MTSQQKPSRADNLRRSRSSRISKKPRPAGTRTPASSRQTSRTSRQSYRPDSVFLPVKPRPVAPTTARRMKNGILNQIFGLGSPSNSKGNPGRQSLRGYSGRATRNSHPAKTRSSGEGYDFSFSLGHTAVHTPQLSLPSLGPRWISMGLTVILVLLLYTMATSNAFKVTAVDVTGNQRLDTSEISASLGLVGKPIYNAIPSQIKKDLLIAFPDLAGASVTIGFPNSLRVSVIERTPVMVWSQGGKTQWIDANGIAFPLRSDVPGLVQVVSNGNPPGPQEDSQKTSLNQPFIDPSMVHAILTLSPQVPGGAPMVYDPKYGVGWQDPHGWSVFFGQNAREIETKKKVYQAILDTFSRQGIQPTLVSVAYLDAPFYK